MKHAGLSRVSRVLSKTTGAVSCASELKIIQTMLVEPCVCKLLYHKLLQKTSVARSTGVTVAPGVSKSHLAMLGAKHVQLSCEGRHDTQLCGTQWRHKNQDARRKKYTNRKSSSRACNPLARKLTMVVLQVLIIAKNPTSDSSHRPPPGGLRVRLRSCWKDCGLRGWPGTDRPSPFRWCTYQELR